jgi:autotransporter-associated beta strand protein
MKTQFPFSQPLNEWFHGALSRAATVVPGAVLALGLFQPSALMAGTFTSNTTDPAGWQAPPGVTEVIVECWGGGGAGGAANNTSVAASGIINVGGGGGAGGAYARKVSVAVTPGNFYAITIPAAAPAPPANSADGLRINGETVSFTGNAATVTASGGQGGASIINSITSTGSGGTGSTVGCVGDVVFAGGSSTAGITSGTAGGGGGGAGSTENGVSTATNAGGAGGISGGGKGGQAATGSNVGNAGGAPVLAGGGGSGARMQRLNGAARAGGAGAAGQITLTWTDPVFSDKLVVTSVPASAEAGVDFSVTVQAQNSGGSPVNVTQDTNITLTASGLGTLSGKTATILSGTDSVTLNTVQYTRAESITLTATGLTGDPLNVSVPSSAFTVNAGVATQLVFTTQPSTPTAVTAPFATQPVVQIRDAFGNVVTTGTDATANVALTLTTGTGTLGGTTNMNAMAGVADFIGKGLNIDQAGTNKLLTATATLNAVPVTKATAPAITITSLALTWLDTPATSNWTTANEVNWSGGSGVYVGPLASSVTFDENGSAASPINLVGTLQPISVTVTSDTKNYTFSGSGKISGTTGITKSGASTLTLATANDHSGITTLSAGTLVSANPLALGTGLVNFSGGSTGTLRISTDGGDTATPISSNSGTANVGTDTWSSNWTIASGVATPGPGINHSLGHLNLALAKMNIVAGPNVSGGNPKITFATMQLTSGSGAAPSLINPTTASVSIGNVTATGGANKTLYLGGTSTGNAITGDISASVALAINKRGSSTWTLSGTNTYTGATTIEQGTLAFGGGSLTSSVIVQDLATLGTAVGSTASTTGDLTFVGPSSKVSVSGMPTLASYTLMTATTITGTPVLDPAIAGYALLVDGGNTLKLVQSGTPYDTWVALYQPGFTNSLSTQDQDGDGLTNQQEFAYGLNPKSGSSVNPIIAGLNNANGDFSFSRNINSGLTYKVWSSVDLATWTERPGAIQTLTGSPDSFGTQTVNVTNLGATAVNGKLFVRVTAN